MTQQSDPFFGLKYIAYCRSKLPANKDEVTYDVMVQFARWQICKARNILFNDTVWEEKYTPEEILVEYFAIRFDEDDKLAEEFQSSIVSASDEDHAWFSEMERKFLQEHETKIEAGELPPDGEFEDKF